MNSRPGALEFPIFGFLPAAGDNLFSGVYRGQACSNQSITGNSVVKAELFAKCTIRCQMSGRFIAGQMYLISLFQQSGTDAICILSFGQEICVLISFQKP